MTWVQSLFWKDSLEKEMATHSIILAGETLWTEELGGLQSMRSQTVGHDRSDLACTYHLFPDKERTVNWPRTPACWAEFSKGLTHLGFGFCFVFLWGLPGGSNGKASACSVGDLGLIPGLGRSPGEGNGNPLQYSCLENSMDGGAWWATVHGVTKSWTQLSGFTFLLFSYT